MLFSHVYLRWRLCGVPKNLLSAIDFIWRLLQIFTYVFLGNLRKKFLCFLYVNLPVSALTFYYLFKSLQWVTIAFHKVLGKITLYCTYLKVQSCKLYYSKYMITSTQIANTEIFAFEALLIFNLLSRKILFINRKENKNC